MPLTFEWDPRKARTNLVKHGIAFEEAATIFGDPSSLNTHLRRSVMSPSEKRSPANCSLSCIQIEAIISALLVQEQPAAESANFMRKAPSKSSRESVQNEYDFSHGVRGKYAHRYAQGTNVVVLEPDVARVFSNSEAVNASLRKIIRAKASVR
jgi:uncharacterized DUF497 family protein